MAGCPYCGNGRAAMMIATEDLMHMLEDMGITTGVDVYKLIEVVWLAEEVVGHPLYGCVSKAGPRPRYDRLVPHGHAAHRDARGGAALPARAERVRASDVAVESADHELDASRSAVSSCQRQPCWWAASNEQHSLTASRAHG